MPRRWRLESMGLTSIRASVWPKWWKILFTVLPPGWILRLLLCEWSKIHDSKQIEHNSGYGFKNSAFGILLSLFVQVFPVWKKCVGHNMVTYNGSRVCIATPISTSLMEILPDKILGRRKFWRSLLLLLGRQQQQQGQTATTVIKFCSRHDFV